MSFKVNKQGDCMRVTPKEMEKLDKIIKEYPETFDWMEMMANRYWMSLSKVLHEYKNYIDKLMCEEDNSRYKS